MTKEYNKNVKILAKKEYTIRDIIRGKAFPWMDGMIERRQYREIKKLIRADSLGENILQVQNPITMIGYKIKGRNIIKFIKIYGKGVALATKKK